MRIVRLANFVAPRSGGLRTSLGELGAGYLAAGHEPVLIIPGRDDSDQQSAQGRVITLRALRVPFTGGYRVLWRRRRVAALLSQLEPDSLEVSDRTTLRWTGRWARRHGVSAVMVSHESLVALFRLVPLGQGLSRRVADWLNRRTARAYQRIICTTSWAAVEFERIGARNLVRVPLGVDLTTFRAGPSGTSRNKATRLSWETMTAGTPCLRAHRPVQRSVTRSETSRESGCSWLSRAATGRRRHITRYPPVNGTRGARSVITRPWALCWSLSWRPGMISTGSCPAAR